MNITTIERALNSFVAAGLGLVVDQDVFRGGLLSGREGLGVEIIGLQRERGNLKTLRGKIVCRGCDRDTVMQRSEAAAGLFPAFGQVIAGLERPLEAVFVENTGFRTTADGGRLQTVGEIYLRILI